jgi:DNA-binding transcriptional MerR regulator
LAIYSIRDLEKISGIKAHTLRVWEQRYSILTPKRTETNIRFYEEEDLRLLLSISMLNSNGYKISRIAKMSSTEIHDTCKTLFEDESETTNQITALTIAMMQLDEDRFEKIIANCTLRHGFEAMMVDIVHPFFERVGILWQTGSIRPAQEHFMSNLLRQKLIVAIDSQSVPRDLNLPRYLLFLPENELHENGLLFATYLLRSRGNHVIYLGTCLPEDDLPSVYETYKPDYFLTFLTLSPPKETGFDYLCRLGSKFPECTILATGHAASPTTDLPDNVKILSSIKDLLAFAERKV